MTQGRKDYPTQARARKWVIKVTHEECAHIWGTRCMQYAVFVYVSSAQAVIQDLFKNRERSEIIDRAKRRRAKQAARETSTLLWGKEKSKRTKNHTKTDFLHFFCKKFVYIKKKQYLCTRNQ